LYLSVTGSKHVHDMGNCNMASIAAVSAGIVVSGMCGHLVKGCVLLYKLHLTCTLITFV